MYSDLVVPNQATQRQNLAIGALFESLTTIAKKTRFESEITEIISIREKYLYKD